MQLIFKNDALITERMDREGGMMRLHVANCASICLISVLHGLIWSRSIVREELYSLLVGVASAGRAGFLSWPSQHGLEVVLGIDDGGLMPEGFATLSLPDAADFSLIFTHFF